MINFSDFLTPPFIVPIITAIIAALGGIKLGQLNNKPVEQNIILDGFKNLVQQTMSQNKELSDKIDELRNEIIDLNAHIDALSEELRKHNISPPIRKKKVLATVEVN